MRDDALLRFTAHELPRLHQGIREKIANVEPGYVTASKKVARYLFAEPAAGGSVIGNGTFG